MRHPVRYILICALVAVTLSAGVLAVSLVQGGCVAPGAVTAKVDAKTPVQANIGPGAGSGGPTSQPASVDADQTAGDGATQTNAAVTISGSAWPIVVLAVVAMALAALWVRASSARREARRQATRQSVFTQQAEQAAAGNERQVLTLAKAIHELGAGPQRDRLLGMISDAMDMAERRPFDALLYQHNLYAKRRDGVSPPAAPGGTDEE